jgi:hypothetical protein
LIYHNISKGYDFWLVCYFFADNNHSYFVAHVNKITLHHLKSILVFITKHANYTLRGDYEEKTAEDEGTGAPA